MYVQVHIIKKERLNLNLGTSMYLFEISAETFHIFDLIEFLDSIHYRSFVIMIPRVNSTE